MRKFNYRIGRIRGTEQASTSLSVKYNKVAPYLGVGYRNRQASNSGWQFTYNSSVLNTRPYLSTCTRSFGLKFSSKLR